MNQIFNRRVLSVLPFVLSLIVLCFAAIPISAQEGDPAAGGVEQATGVQSGDLIRVLELTPDQLTKIRMVRQQNKEERQLAGERLRRAQQALDEAIYSDDASEAVIEERARELAAAQAATVRFRALTEYNIRRILTPEQLNKLRALRLLQARKRRLEREMNQERPLLRDRQPGNNRNQPNLPSDGFRQRPNASPQPNNNGRPAVLPRVRRGGILRPRQP